MRREDRMLLRLISRVDHTTTPATLTLECGHDVKRDYSMTQLAKIRARLKAAPAFRYAETCEGCAAIPHPVTNREVWEKARFG